jgi:1-acyl-sn-glycerol-3-phosphate acyltransferase
MPKSGLLYKIGFYVRAALVGLWFLTSSAIGIVITALNYGDPTNSRRFSRLNSWLGLPLLGMRIDVKGGDVMWGARPCVYVTNHQSNEDIFFHGAFYPSRTVVTGKRELIRIPLFGWMFAAMGNILLDRNRHDTAVQQLGAAADRIRNEGISVWLFPEGHRNKTDQLLAFKRGGFHLAVLAQVPVVPIATQRYSSVLDMARQKMYGGTVHIEILDPIPTIGLTEADVPALAERAQQAVEEALARMGPVRPGRPKPGLRVLAD